MGRIGQGIALSFFFTRLILIEFIQYWDSMILWCIKDTYLHQPALGQVHESICKGAHPEAECLGTFLCLLPCLISAAACYIILLNIMSSISCCILSNSAAIGGTTDFRIAAAEAARTPKGGGAHMREFSLSCDWVFCLSKFRCFDSLLLVSSILFSPSLIFGLYNIIKPAVQPTTVTTVKHFASLGDWTITEFAG